MNPDEVARTCDELHEYIDQGPGENPGIFAHALTVVRRLRAAASWDHPLTILTQLEMELAGWFSPDRWRGADEGEGCRQALLSRLSSLEDAWERPRS
jgi:hypothetical protein